MGDRQLALDSKTTNGFSHLVETTAERVKEQLRQDIIHGVFEPGSRMRIAEIATRYGISHMPVREALRQLEGDRIVHIHPHRGAVLRAVDAKFVADIYDLRGAIEVLLAARCVDNVTDTEAKRLKTLAVSYERAAKDGSYAGMLEANQNFHREINRIADNTEAANLVNQGWDLINAVRMRFGFGPKRIAAIVREHRDIVDAIAARDREQAIAVAQRHRDAAKEDMLTQMKLHTENC